MVKSNSKNKITIDDLALMVSKGFDEMNGRMDNGFKNLKKELKKEILDTKNELKAELNKKVDRFEHKSLEIQVEKIEEKIEAISKK